MHNPGLAERCEDPVGVRPEDVAALVQHLPKEPEYYRPADSGHFSFLFPCSSEVAKADPLECADAPGFDRADFHTKLNAQVLTFFRKTLPSNADR